MIIVTGATGQLGRQVVERLLTHVPAERIGVSVRDPRKANDFADQGIRVREGSFTDPALLARAFEGATQVLIISVDKLGDEAIALHRAGIDAAVAAGARRILYTSHAGASPTSLFQPGRDHAATEDALRASGVPFTALRNGFYAASALRFVMPALESGRLALPEDGPVNWTTHADLAEATARILADEGCFDGPTPPLAASQALTFADIARIVTETTGRTLTRITMSDEEFVAGLVRERGIPVEHARQLLGMFTASRAGEFAAADPALSTLLGRETGTLRAML